MTRCLMVPLRRVGLGVAAVTAAAVLSACSHLGNSASSAPLSNPPSASAVASASPAAATPPVIVGVTTTGALVTLNPTTGITEQTLVPGGVTGGGQAGSAVAVTPSGMVFFVVPNRCGSTIEEVPVTGGQATVIGPGSAPAVSPDGTKLAYASAPESALGVECPSAGPNLDEWVQLKIRTLSSGVTVTLAALPAGQGTGLPHPISHLSWSGDNRHVAVSISPPEDNDGWAVNLVDTAQAHYFVAGSGVVTVPVSGSPDPEGTYLREAVFMPNGELFVSRACCAGVPVVNTSRLMWEVTTSGAFVHQVAIGYPNLEHTSLDVSSDGQWLLYVAGTPSYVAGTPPTGTLYVSQGGATPRELTTGIVAAAWS